MDGARAEADERADRSGRPAQPTRRKEPPLIVYKPEHDFAESIRGGERGGVRSAVGRCLERGKSKHGGAVHGRRAGVVAGVGDDRSAQRVGLQQADFAVGTARGEIAADECDCIHLASVHGLRARLWGMACGCDGRGSIRGDGPAEDIRGSVGAEHINGVVSGRPLHHLSTAAGVGGGAATVGGGGGGRAAAAEYLCGVSEQRRHASMRRHVPDAHRAIRRDRDE